MVEFRLMIKSLLMIDFLTGACSGSWPTRTRSR